MGLKSSLVVLLASAVLIASGRDAALASPGTTTRVSVDSAGNQANDISCCPAISGDGAFVGFYSSASNLVAGDTNGQYDVFLHDRINGGTELVSIGYGGVLADGPSYSPDVSPTGRFVAFESLASNLHPGGGEFNINCDYNGDTLLENCIDIYARDRLTSITSLVSRASSGAQAQFGAFDPAIDSGRYVAFTSYSSNLVDFDNHTCSDFGYAYNCGDIFVRDQVWLLTERVSIDSNEAQSNGDSYNASLSADGRYVAFESVASNLVPGDTNNWCDNNSDQAYTENCSDIFVIALPVRLLA